MSDELEPDDKALLKNIDAFNQARATTGWHLRGKVLTEDLSRVRLIGSSMESVRALHSNWSAAFVSYSQFTNMVFLNCNFAGAEFENATFTNCRFELCSFEKATFVNCRWVACNAEDTKAQGATYQDCHFQSLQDHSGVFTSATLRKCIFERCLLDNSSFYKATIESVALKSTTLTNVIFSAICGREFRFEDATIRNCGFEKSHFGDIAIVRGANSGLTFDAFDAEAINIELCDRIEQLTVRRSHWISTSVMGCAAISELTIDGSQLQNLSIVDCELAYFELSQTEVSGACLISNCQLAGVNLERSILRGGGMSKCTLSVYLMIDGATFDGFMLHGLRYAPGLKITGADVHYSSGASQFPAA